VKQAEDIILEALAEHGPQSGLKLQRLTFLGVVSLYGSLLDLEMKGRITSRWVDEPFPRRRLYELPVNPSTMPEANDQSTPSQE